MNADKLKDLVSHGETCVDHSLKQSTDGTFFLVTRHAGCLPCIVQMTPSEAVQWAIQTAIPKELHGLIHVAGVRL